MQKLIFALFLFCFGFQLQAQPDEYSDVYFIGYGGTRKLYVNDRLITTFGDEDIVHLKLYSTGRLTVTYLTMYYRKEGVLDIKEPGKYYFMGMNPEKVNKQDINNESVAPEIFEEFKSNLEKRKGFTYNVIDIEENYKEPIGKIDYTKSGKNQCTCFLMDNQGYVLTNAHCIENAKEINIRGIGNDFSTKYGAGLVAVDASNDLALIKIKNQLIKFDTPPFAIRSKGVEQAEKVFALGFPKAEAMGEEVKITEGIISAKSGVQNDVSKFQISAAVNPGNSGGPLIDESGNVIGVINSKSTVAESAGYAIKAAYLETFLHNIDGYEPMQLSNGLKDKSFPEKITALRGAIFIVETESLASGKQCF